jgi:hypothetical protein
LTLVRSGSCCKCDTFGVRVKRLTIPNPKSLRRILEIGKTVGQHKQGFSEWMNAQQAI